LFIKYQCCLESLYLVFFLKPDMPVMLMPHGMANDHRGGLNDNWWGGHNNWSRSNNNWWRRGYDNWIRGYKDGSWNTYTKI
jgi:hypothetical protein